MVSQRINLITNWGKFCTCSDKFISTSSSLETLYTLNCFLVESEGVGVRKKSSYNWFERQIEISKFTENSLMIKAK